MRSTTSGDKSVRQLWKAAAFLAFTLALAVVTVWPTRTKFTVKEANVEPLAQAQGGPRAERDHDVRGDVDSLARRVRELEQRLAEPPAETPPSRPGSPSAEEEERRGAEMMLRYDAKLEQIAAGEREDERWTADLGARLRESLATLREPMQISTLRCSATLCVVELSHSAARAHVPFAEPFVHAAWRAPKVGGRVRLHRLEQPDGTFLTKIFLARAGESLPPIDDPSPEKRNATPSI